MDNSEDITLDLPLSLEGASALHVILDLFIQSHEGMETQPRPEGLPPEVTDTDFKLYHMLIMGHAKELLKEVRELIEEHGDEPEKPKKKIILPGSKF